MKGAEKDEKRHPRNSYKALLLRYQRVLGYLPDGRGSKMEKEVVPILRELKEAAPLGYTALCKNVCPHSFGLRDSMREKCRELEGCFKPLFCEDCWREAIDD